MHGLDLSRLPSPCYVIDEVAVERNLAVLHDVRRRAGATVLLALKGFAAWPLGPLVARHLSGVAASSLHEARLGREAFGGELHVYAPAYRDDEFDAIAAMASHLVFNSFGQWQRFRGRVPAGGPRCGMHVNPEHSEVATAIYDPCAPRSRLGVTAAEFDLAATGGLSGLHFHTLCELNADALQRTLGAFEAKFADALGRVDWVNFGGGHHVSRPGYDVDLLVRLIGEFRARHGVEVIIEPGEAAALNAGVLVATVLDVARNDIDIAILDTSATAHMPDVLEMPYRPDILGAAAPGAKPHTFRLGGLTCLAGDVVGDYSFDAPLQVGQKLVFDDMAHYTMVKNTTFNGVNLPAIAIHNSESGATRVVREFGYEDYKGRLG